MLADPKSEALITNFTGQWLSVRSLKTSEPVVNLFPDFDDNLRNAFQRETELFFDSIVHEDRSVLDLLTADYTFVNERLAKHYGIPNIYGPQFRRVTLRSGARHAPRPAGQGRAADGDVEAGPHLARRRAASGSCRRSSASAPPDPPPNVPAIKEKPPDIDRQREGADHARRRWKRITPIRPARRATRSSSRWDSRSKTSTRSAPGAPRMRACPIDATGVLVDGTKVDGVASLRDSLVRYSDQFVRVVTEKLLTYALGRGVEYQDMPMVRSIVRDSAAEQVPVLFARAGHREERRVPDEHENRAERQLEQTAAR